jgi:hypothetical protein
MLLGVLVIIGVVLLIAGHLARQDSPAPQTPDGSDDDNSGVQFK